MRGHATNCADAVRTTPDQCRCQCAGAFHGGPHSERVRALLWPEANRHAYSRGVLSRAKSRARQTLEGRSAGGVACTDFAVIHAVDELIWTSDTDTQDLARDVMVNLIESFVTQILDADLDEADSKQLEVAVNNLHLVCAMCAAILEALDSVRELTDALTDEVAGLIVDEAMKEVPLSPAARAVLRSALRSAFRDTINLALADPARVRMLQLVGYATCPDVAEHPEVRRYCVKPLADDLVTTAMDEWIGAGFPLDSSVMARAKPRRKN